METFRENEQLAREKICAMMMMKEEEEEEEDLTGVS